MLPGWTIAVLAVARDRRGLRLAIDMHPDKTVTISLDFLTPERAVRALTLAAVYVAEGVHIQLPHERMAHEQPRQVVGDLEALRAGGGECFRQRLLPDQGTLKRSST